jgi:hypothetical protein
MNTKSYFLYLIVTILLASCLCFSAVIEVPGDISTIQSAIDTAVSGDKIIVSPGTYYEKIAFYGKDITLQSTDPTSFGIIAATIIDAQNFGSVITFSGTEKSSCTLSGLKITNGFRLKGGGGIYGNDTHATICNNIIYNNKAEIGAGLYYCSGLIENNQITSNEADAAKGSTSTNNGGGGLFACHGTIRGNLINGNSTYRYENYSVYGGGLLQCYGEIVGNTIRGNSSSGFGGGLYNCDGLVQKNQILNNNTKVSGGGLARCDGEIYNNIIAGNKASVGMQGVGNGGGIYWCDAKIINNVIYNNSVGPGYGENGGGIYASKATIRNCIIWGNSPNQVYDSTPPAYSCVQNMSYGPGIISINPMFEDEENGDFRLRPESPCIDAGRYTSDIIDDFNGNLRPFTSVSWQERGDGSHFDIGAFEYIKIIPEPAITPTPTPSPTPYPTPICMSEPEPTPFPVAENPILVPIDFTSIQEAIDASSDGDTIIVSPGIYEENILFKGKNITLRSEEPTSPPVVCRTIIDGLFEGSVAVFSGSEVSTCTLAGFTIRHGYTTSGAGIKGNGTNASILFNLIVRNSSSIMISSGVGGGISRCHGDIRYNWIMNNEAYSAGGLNDCDGLIECNAIMNNYSKGGNGMAGGLYLCDGIIRSNYIYNNRVAGGSYSGSGGGLNKCNAVIERNVIKKNRNYAGYGGGIYNCNGPIRFNVITENYARYYGGGISSSSGDITGNIISYNTLGSSYGAGIYGCSGDIINNVIYGNESPNVHSDGGGIAYCNGSIRNCIILENDKPDVYKSSFPKYSCVTYSSDPTNITASPQFVDPENGDFHITRNSPCIDAGSFVDGLNEDIDANSRPIHAALIPDRGDGSYFDIGAYEYPEVITGELFLSKIGEGSISINSSPVELPFEESINLYEKLVIEAHPDEYYNFIRWEGDIPDGSELDNPTTVTMNDDKDIKAVFELSPPEVSINPWSLNFVMDSDQTDTKTISITNTVPVMCQDLNYDIEVLCGKNKTGSTVGDNDKNFSMSHTYKGGIYHITENSLLSDFEMYLNFSGETEIDFVVFQSESRLGTYRKIFSRELNLTGSGEKFYSSGVIGIPLIAGNYYLLAAGSESTITFYYKLDSINPQPVSVHFGTWTSYFSSLKYPIDETEETNGTLAQKIYQRVNTCSGDKWLSVFPPSGAIEYSNFLNIDVNANSMGISPGQFSGSLLISTNDPDNPTTSVPVSMTVLTPTPTPTITPTPTSTPSPTPTPSPSPSLTPTPTPSVTPSPTITSTPTPTGTPTPTPSPSPTVTPTSTPVPVALKPKTDRPAEITTSTTGTVTIWGHVFLEGVTTGIGQGEGIDGMVGFGDYLTSPSYHKSWKWYNAEYLRDVDGMSPGDHLVDEYFVDKGDFIQGKYSYCYRFRNTDAEWIYGDLQGTDNGFLLEKMGVLTVYPLRIDIVDLLLGREQEGDMDINGDGRIDVADLIFLILNIVP